MAEFVQQNIEEMLPELEQMERVGLFTAVETRQMLKKRRAFEYKLRRRTRQKNDYIQYIQYEINVLALVRKRREKTGYTFKRLEIDVAIVQRVHRLFKNACVRFPDDMKLWMYYVQFCQRRKEKASVSKIYSRMLQLHSRKPALWIRAAQFELEVILSVDNARSLLQRGIRFNPESQIMWHEYYRFELLNTERICARRKIVGISNTDADDQESSQAAVDGKVALAVYTLSLDAFSENIELLLGFLPICRLFKFTKPHEEKILEDLQLRFPEHELTWDALARKHLHLSSGKVKSSQRSQCYEVFDLAVKTVNTVRMWDLYLECCMEHMHGKHIEQKTDQVLSTFRRACGCNLLSESMYLKWVQLLQKEGLVEDISQVLTKATVCYKASCAMWLSRLAWEQQVAGASVETVFEQALQNVPQKLSVPLWRAQLMWAGVHCPPDAVTSLYDRAVGSAGPQVAEAVKPAYLQWTALHRGNKSVRTLYDRLAAAKPLPLEFFQEFIAIQKAQAPTKIKPIRAAHEAAVEEYGATDPEVWLAYITMEMQHAKSTPAGVAQLHWRALKVLDAHTRQVFTERYTLLQTCAMEEQ